MGRWLGKYSEKDRSKSTRTDYGETLINSAASGLIERLKNRAAAMSDEWVLTQVPSLERTKDQALRQNRVDAALTKVQMCDAKGTAVELCKGFFDTVRVKIETVINHYYDIWVMFYTRLGNVPSSTEKERNATLSQNTTDMNTRKTFKCSSIKF